jgi:hypothetical protein
MPATLSLRCPACNARLKAPTRLLGQWRSCPACAKRLLVRVQAPPDAAPVLAGAVPASAAAGTAATPRRPWTPVEDVLVRSLPPGEAARRTGRPLEAVYARRDALGA